MGHVENKSKGVLGQGDAREMWDEIVSHIPDEIFLKKDLRILNVACGHAEETKAIIRRMLALGVSKRKIRESIWLNDKYSNFTSYWKQHGFNVVDCDFLKWKTNMKFDVVIGNPPYQEANDSGNALWPKFVEKSMNDLVVNGGKLCFVTPASWIGKKSKGGKVNYSSFVNNKMDHLVMFDSKKKDEYFPGVGTTLCWYIIEKSPAIGKTRVVQYTNGQRHAHEIMIEEGKEYPAMFTSEAMSIHRKLTEHTPMNFSQTRELHYYTMKKKGTVNETQNRKFPYKSYFSHNITRYASYQMKDYTSWKTMVPQTATAKDSFVDKECNVSEDLLYVKCKTKKEALNCRNVLCSTLYRYISAAYRKGRNMSGFTIFPNVDLTRTWTDKELYKHFKLTKEEIAYIEATVK